VRGRRSYEHVAADTERVSATDALDDTRLSVQNALITSVRCVHIVSDTRLGLERFKRSSDGEQKRGCAGNARDERLWDADVHDHVNGQGVVHQQAFGGVH